MNSTQIFAAIEEIASVSGKNDKQALLAQYIADPDFFQTVFLALDPFTTFGVRPSRIEGSDSGRHWNEITTNILGALARRDLTGNLAYDSIALEMTELNKPSSELLWRVLNKDLKAGFSEASVNKVRKGSFKTFPYMRCSLPKDANLKSWPWAEGVLSQDKADGMFFDGNIEGEATRMTTRQGNPIPTREFEEVLIDLSELSRTPAQTHGEMLVINDKGEVCAREIGNGILNKVIQGGNFPPGHYPKAVIWDMIPAEAVMPKGSYKTPYISRLRGIKAAIYAGKLTRVTLIETRIVRSLKEAYKHYAEVLKRGGEGTVIKKPEMIWRDHTSKDQVKLKLEAPCELVIVGFEPGKEGAKTESTFGSLMLESSDGLLKVNCSGFPDALRYEINCHRSDWLGSIVTCLSNGIMYSSDESKKAHSLFLPRYIERRYDKTEADSFEQVIKQFENAISLIEAEAASE